MPRQNQRHFFGIFQESVMLVTEHNAHASEHSYTLELNEFADTSAEEFRKTHFGNSPQDCSATHTGPYVVVLYNHIIISLKVMYYRNGHLKYADAPVSRDWRDEGIVSPVKNQGQCGSCW